ncbi:TRAP transporter substrate-binding protein [Frigidibacter sp. MR17.24]|uniref:TRAP transporter substrate-binding protein n=1 Tax=Frigidibacter sp. MR17.24 TaxID=3127345 RepID=UPI003012CA81
MKRRDFLKNAGPLTLAAGVAAPLATPALAQSMPEVNWRLVSSFPANLDVLYGCSTTLAETVAEITEGKFKIQTFSAGEIVPGLQAFDAAANGTVEVAHSASYYYTGKDPAFALGTHVPFMLSTRQQMAWAEQGEGREMLAEFYDGYGVVAFPGGNTSTQMGGWFRKEIASLDDLKGLKFRISGLGGRVLEKLGAVPQQIAISDIYPSLERGTIDAAEFNGPYDDEKLGLYRVAPHYYYPGFWDGTSMQHFFVGKSAWEQLPEGYKGAFKAAAAKVQVTSIARYDTLNPAALRRLVANGAQLHSFPVEILDAAYDATMEIYEGLAAENPWFDKMWKSQLAFQRDVTTWNQVSELAYDQVVLRELRRG